MQLIDIQKLQFSDREAAESMMLAFLKEHEDPSIKSVELRPKPESLNSINGFINYLDGERLFFKTHVEENEQLPEYYNAIMLSKAGYPVVSAKQITHRPGKQIALYEIVSFPTLFDLLKQEEDEQLGGAPDSELSASLLAAQTRLDQTVYSIYESTVQHNSPEAMGAKAPIHQLFYHRLAEDGRYGLFYKGKSIPGENGELKFDELANMRWTINGVRYKDTLAELIERSRRVLSPDVSLSIIGHGDAHNGNIFVDQEKQQFCMFDPAFAGRHDPALDLTKPLFHNIFARWMYYPEQVSNEFDLTFKISGNEIIVEHDFFPSRLRMAHLQAKKDHLLKPTLKMIEARNAAEGGRSRDKLREYLHSSLFCCPFLTVNLFAPFVADGTLAERYSLPIKLLGLSTAVALGSLTHEKENGLSAVVDDLFES